MVYHDCSPLAGEVGVRSDRGLLLQTKSHLERGLGWVSLSRVEGEGVLVGVELMHSELLYSLTRVNVKLADTLPPPGNG